MRRLKVPGCPHWFDGSHVAALIFSFAWAVLCDMVLDLLQSGGNFALLATHTIRDTPILLLLNAGLVWCVLLLVWTATGRLWIAATVVMSAAVVVGYANHMKVSLRGEPLYPSDLGFASNTRFLTQMVGVGPIALMTVFLALIALVILMSSRIISRRFKRHAERMKHALWLRLVARISVAAMALTMLGYASQFNRPGNRLRAAYENGGAEWAFWFQKLNYMDNGFVAGVLYNTDVPAMTRPASYNPATMRTIAIRYASRAATLNRTRRHDLNDINIVLILSETFSDPEQLKGVTYDEDPIPFTRRLMAKTTSGRMLAQLYGGGTANIEFELLTGMSLAQFAPQMQAPYQMLIPHHSDFPSVVGYAKAKGLTPLAIHPYMTSMYKRETVYPILGFEDFLSEGELQSEKKIDDSNFISDDSAFQEVTYQIEQHRSPLLINLVTMQNHWPMGGSYDDPLRVRGPTADAIKQASGYGRGLRHTDTALKSLLFRLKKSPEKTAVVFYGDHQPAIWQKPITELNGDLAMKTTPFLMWANFSTPRQELPQTSPAFFLPLLFRLIGAPLPPYYALLHDLHQKVPALGQGRILDPNGRELTESHLSPTARRLLRDYRLIQYDLSIGKRYSQSTLFYPAESATTSRVDE